MAQPVPNQTPNGTSIEPPQAQAAPPLPNVASENPVAVDDKFQELGALLDRVDRHENATPSTPTAENLSHSPPPAPAEAPLPKPESNNLAANSQSTSENAFDNRLAQGRLGLASSLLTALRCRDAATAAHCVRVALSSSTWAVALNLTDTQRENLEIAALLHDIGKIGIPDAVLLKPGPLNDAERLVMDTHRTLGLQILESCYASSEVLHIVQHCHTWYDGSVGEAGCTGTDIPLESRILAITNAFDTMINTQVYRPAMSHDRAIQELCQCAGTQFDPELAYHFAQLFAADQQNFHGQVARRWLQQLESHAASDWWWQQPFLPAPYGVSQPDALHQQKLLENMYDGVVFLGPQMQIMHWNRGAERLTGVNGASVMQRLFSPALIHLRDADGRRIPADQCPASVAMRTGVQSRRRFTIRGRSESDLFVDLHIIPVVGPDGATQGVTLLIHDASDEASLEERCHHLYEKAIRDPLTQLANRAEFDRAHALFLEAHRQRRLPFSLVICDLDHFKAVNDTYGHLAGDEAIKSFAQLLKSFCHPGDLVARFGGEEFVILFADCNNPTATARAEQIRRAFHEMPQALTGGAACTASFGVTELQPGDTVQTMLNRADRALLMAKQAGRNIVVQLGSGGSEEPVERRNRWWFWQSKTAGPLLECDLATNVPINITAEKLRGFVSDQRGQITSVQEDQVEILIQSGKFGTARRRSDRCLPLYVKLLFKSEERNNERVKDVRTVGSKTGPSRILQTRIHVLIRAQLGRERRRYVTVEQARHVMASLKAYLMANELDPRTMEAETPPADPPHSSIMMSAWLNP